MNKSLRSLVPLLLAVLLPTPVYADPTTIPASPGKGEQRALDIFHMLDADGDGRIARAEAALAMRLKPSLTELFREADTNDDDYLTQNEIRAAAKRKRTKQLANNRDQLPSENLSDQ